MVPVCKCVIKRQAGRGAERHREEDRDRQERETKRDRETLTE